MPAFRTVDSVPVPPGAINLDFGPPTIARSCGSLPVFLISKVTLPVFSSGGASTILNSISVTFTLDGVAAAGAAGVFAAACPCATVVLTSIPACL